MQQDYSSMTIRQFVDAVSEETPTPGGGSVCGVAGSMAGGLTMMCASYTLHRERFSAVWNEVRAIHARAEQLRDHCLVLSAEDAVVFQRVMDVLKEPKGTPEEEQVRTDHIDAQLCRAADVLVQIAKAGKEISSLASRLVDIGNPSLRADAVVASELAEVVIHGCIDQIRDNLEHISNEDLRKEVADQVATLA